MVELLGNWKQFDSLGPCEDVLWGTTRAVLGTGLAFPVVKESPCERPTLCLVNYSTSCSCSWRHAISQAPCVWDLQGRSFQMAPLLVVGSFPPCGCWSLLSWTGKQSPLWTPRVLSLSKSLCSGILPPRTPALWKWTSLDAHLCLLIPGRPRAPTPVPFPAPRPGDFLRAGSWGKHRVHLIGFPSSWEHCSSLSDVHCLAKLSFVSVFIYFSQPFQVGRQI